MAEERPGPERLPQWDRVVFLSGLAVVVILSWGYLLAGAGMSMHEMGGMLMPMAKAVWDFEQAVLMLVMWSVMMAAMMLPSAAPMFLLYATIQRRRDGGGGALALGMFGAGYLVVWGAFSAIAVALQFGLSRATVLSPMMQVTSVAVAGLVLAAAGLYQWTPLKQACLRHCRSPLDFVLTNWRDGTRGAFVMGVRHGAYCLGCCWALMLLLFVGGVMNMAWIAGLAIFVLVEKIAPAGHWIGRAAGIALVAWGVGTLLTLA